MLDSQNVENYEFDEATQRVTVTYTFNENSFNGKVNKSGQKGRVAPKDANGTHWNVKPIILAACGITLPIWLDYYILDVPDDYSYLSCAAPTGWWCYIMTRKQICTDEELAPRVEHLKSLGIDTSKLIRVPHKA